MKKKATKEEQALFLGDRNVPDDMVDKEIERIKRGQDDPLTGDVFPDEKDYSLDPLAAFNDASDRVKEFITAYQPGLLIERNAFKLHLLEVLEDWK
jgi:hypothetical protein